MIKSSTYAFIKNRNLENNNYDSLLKKIDINSEIIKIQECILNLRRKVSSEKEDISEFLKNLEYFLPIGNNNKNLEIYLYNSKLFLDIVECIQFAANKHIQSLLTFLEKIIRGNKYIARYLSKNMEFVRTIINLMKVNVSYTNLESI